MAGLSTGAGAPVVKVYHEKSMILPDVSRVLACLYEKDVKFVRVTDSYKDILRLQASTSVPVPFYHGPTFLQESRAICRYIAETYEQHGYPFLLGKDVLERASIEQWLRHEENAFNPPSRALFCHLAFPLHDEDNDDFNREKRKLEEVLEVYEQRLGESEFLAGKIFTLADLVHLPNTHHILTSEKLAYLYDSRKNVQRWWNTVSARYSWQQVLRDMKSVEEQYQKEEFEKQRQQQWQTQHPPTSGVSNIRIDHQQSKAPSTGLKVSDLSPLEAELKEDTQGAMSGDDRFSTKRLRKMFDESEAAAPKPQSAELQAPAKEETPFVYKKPSDVQDRKRQAGTASAEGKNSTPSTGTRAPNTPTSADERGDTSLPKEGMARDDRGATEPRKTPSMNVQEPGPPVPSQSPTTSVWRASASSNGAAPDEDLAQLSTTDQWRQTSAPQSAHGPSDDMLGKTSGTDQIATPAAPKQTPTQGVVPDVHHTGDDTTKKPAVDKKPAPTPPRQEPVSNSQETTEPIKGSAPTSHGITGDNSSKIAMADESATSPAPVQAPASDGRIASTSLKGGTLDAHVKNEAVKPSGTDPRGMSTTPRRPEPTPDTQRRNTSDQASGQSPPLPSFTDTRNEKTGIAEAGRTNTIAPNKQPGGGVPKNAGALAAGPSPMKSQKNMSEASIQQMSSDQSRAQQAEKKKQGDDATLLTEIGKAKEGDFLANDKQKSTAQAQATSTDGPSKLQMQSDQNNPISSKDIVKRTNETSRYHSSAPSRVMSPSVPEESMREQQLQGDRSSISPPGNVRQGSEATLPVSGTEQPKKRDLLTDADQNSGKTPGEALQKSEERTSSDTRQVKRNTSNSKSDGSSNPTQFDGNEGNLPETQSRGSSTNP